MSSTHSGYVSLVNGKLHYLKMGQGKRLLLAFHGYGNNASLFFPFEPYLQHEFTLLSFDLPYHGRSGWGDDIMLHKADLKQLLREVTNEHGVEKASLMGYSMGGRVCLTITELMPDQVEQVMLLASDGLVFNSFYHFVTKTLIGRKIFRSFLTDPSRYMKLVEWLRNRNIIDASRYKFAMRYLESEGDRNFLLRVWPGLSLIVPNRLRLKKAISSRNIPVYVFMGNYDKVIPVRHARSFQRGLPSVQLFILDKGHRLFDGDTLPQMAGCLIAEK